MARICRFFFFIALPFALGQNTQDVAQKLDPKTDADKVSPIKEIPLTEIIHLHALPWNEKDVAVALEKKTDEPQIIGIKPAVKQVNTSSPIIKYVPENGNKPNIGKKSRKWAKKQKEKMKKKNKLMRKQFRKKFLNRKKQLIKKNKGGNQTKKWLKNSGPDHLSEAIDRILSLHKSEDGSKFPSENIKQQIIEIMNEHQVDKQRGKFIKDCKKPVTKKRKSRKLLRSFNRNRSLKKRPGKKTVAIQSKQNISVSKGRRTGKGIKPNEKGRLRARKRTLRQMKKGSKLNKKSNRKNDLDTNDI